MDLLTTVSSAFTFQKIRIRYDHYFDGEPPDEGALFALGSSVGPLLSFVCVFFSLFALKFLMAFSPSSLPPVLGFVFGA